MNYKQKPLFEHISQVLKDRIVSGKYPPKSVISEKEICKEFGVSRTPFREAIKKLEELRLVEVVPRFGTYVSEVNFHEVKYAFEVRLALEPWSCKLAAERRTEEQLARLETLIKKWEKEVLIRNLNSVLISSNVDTLCHETIDESSGNPILTADLNNLRIICSRIWTSSLREKLPLSQFSSQWMNIYQAVKDSDGETAGSIMLEHVQSTIQCLREGFF